MAVEEGAILIAVQEGAEATRAEEVEIAVEEEAMVQVRGRNLSTR